jgi:hypothetical protein
MCYYYAQLKLLQLHIGYLKWSLVMKVCIFVEEVKFQISQLSTDEQVTAPLNVHPFL